MTHEILEDAHIEGQNNKKKGKVKKNVLKSLLAVLIAGGIITTAGGARDIKKAKDRKDNDKGLYGITKAKPGGKITVFPGGLDGGPDSLDIPLDTIMEQNRDIISIDATKLESIMLGEESLKTKNGGATSDFDAWLEFHGIDRNPHSESIIGKILGKYKQGSYGPYQVQAEAIDKYKDNPELYDNLCKEIAKLKLPDSAGKFVPLHEQLGLTEEDMVKQIKSHEIYTFKGGGRFLIAYGIVLIDQISRETDAMIGLYNGDKGYNTWINNTGIAEKEHTELVGDDNNIMSPYILQNKGAVSYSSIGDIFNNNAFETGMVSAYRCMDYVKNVENSNYLFTLSLLELNEWFKNGGKGDLDINIPTGRFGEATLELVNKHFNQNFKELEDAKKFMDELPEETLQKLRKEALNNFEINIRLLYTLNTGDIHGINQTQSKYLSECLDLSFNHIYAGVLTLSRFINDKGGNNSSEINARLYEYRNDFVKHQNKDSLEKLKKIMTYEENFTSFTGLKRSLYLEWIKYNLGPTLLGASDWVYQTKGIIPVIQKYPGGTKMSNEQNSIYRFSMGVSQEQIAQADRERGVKYTLKLGETNIDSLKNIMWSKKPVKEYLQKCKTIDGDSITSPQDIPDELVSEMLRGNDDFYPLFEDGQWFYEGDTIYIKYIGLGDVYHKVDISQPATKEIEEKKVVIKRVKIQGTKKGKSNKGKYNYIKIPETIKKNVNLCTVNENGTLSMGKGGTFQEVLYFYSQNDPQMKKILEIIAGKPILQQSDIDQNIIKKIIRHTDGSARININTVSYGDKFIITIPLNY